MNRSRAGSRAAIAVAIALAAVLGMTLSGSSVLAVGPATDRAIPAVMDPPLGSLTVAPAFVPDSNTITVGTVPGSTPMNILVGLASPESASESAQAVAEYVPGSGAYHQYLSPSQIAALYGPNPATVASAMAYFSSYGLTARPLSGGSLLSVTGLTSGVAAAFGTSFDEYRSAAGRAFISHPTPALLPGGLPWTGAYGLGDATPIAPLIEPLSGSTAVAGPAAACAPGGSGLSPCQIWGAYDAAGLIANGTNGTGVRIGVVDTYDGTETAMQLGKDLAQFDSTFSLPAPKVSYNYPDPGPANLNSSSTGWALEEALDIEWSHASAPGASIAMTFSPNSGVGLYEAVDWLVSNHLVDVISLSWGEPDVGVYNAYSGACSSACNASSDGSYELLGPVLEAAALEGISVFVASGDCGSADGTSGVSTNYPSSDPFVTGVGGTLLSVNSTGAYQGESAWSGNESGKSAPGCMNGGGSGGGYAPFPRPWWQHGTGIPSSPATRGDPDVADDAETGVEIVEGGGTGAVGGTSLSTPLWAGIAAIADQHAGGPLGFLDPTLYSILRGSNYSTDFHDITTGNNGYYRAHTGWDAVTGIGTPIVGHLILDLPRASPSASSLEAYLYAGPRSGNAPLTVSFHVAASGGSDAYPLEDVYFGDGTSAIAIGGVSSHTYPTAGVYGASAYVADSSGNVSVSEPFPIVVGGGTALEVNLTASTTSPTVGATVEFNATVHGGTGPYSYTFTYGDGTYLNWTSSDSENHSYAVPGGFCADVLVRDSGSPVDGGASAGLAVQVGGGANPTCVNDSTPLTVEADATPGVLDAPADFPSLFQVFGGSEGSGNGSFTEQLSSSDPYVAACQCTIFRAPGNYTVSLNASDPVGAQTSNSTNVTVAPSLVGTFSASPTYGVAPLTVHFAASVSGGWKANAADTSWTVNTSTGQTLTGAAVSMTYPTAGLYFATGDVSDAGHGNASEGFLIDVIAAGGPALPTVTATVTPAVNVTSGTTVRVAAQSQYANGSALPSDINWSLWDGASVLGPSTAATFDASGGGSGQALDLHLNVSWPTLDTSAVSYSFYSPSFLAVDPGGFVPRADALVLSAHAGPSWGALPMTWSASANVSGPGVGSPVWSFGDGTGGLGPEVRHIYSTQGLYSASVTVNDTFGDAARLPFGVNPGGTIYPALTLTTAISVQHGTAPLTVDFSATAAGGDGGYSYTWYFGDGGVAYVNSTEHTYHTAGNYTVSLVLTDRQGHGLERNWTIQVATNLTAIGSGSGGLPWALILGIGAIAGLATAVGVLVARRRRRTPPTP
ncbi:MAG TPA: PKD domain-containing protein [Thermoplasmata archaeon]|nr:PKD domain-containing protein [Thermoplasmata archaeon]